VYSLERYRKIGFGIVCALIGLLVVWLLLPLWQAFAWGIALSILVFPLYRRLEKRMSPNFAAATTTLLALLFIVLPISLIGLAIYGEAHTIATHLKTEGSENPVETTIAQAQRLLEAALQSLGIENFDLKKTLQDGLQPLLGNVPLLIRSAIKGALNFIFALLLLFFVLRDARKLSAPSLDLIPLPADKSQKVLDSVYDTVHATFFGIVLVALVQGTLTGIALWVLGLPAPLMWGMATVVLCTLPFVGAPVVWVPMCLLLASQNRWVEAAGLALFGILVIGLVDNVFRPIIIGARVKLHAIAVFFAIMGGILTLGPIGILVGPVLLSVALGAVEVLRGMASVSTETEATPS
jgi:predicted PurR-regulated permease PerM